jgi:hypothetical protein
LKAIDNETKRIKLIEQREHFYNVADNFKDRFDSIINWVQVDPTRMQNVGRFNVTVDDAKVIEAELIPWFKKFDFKCISIEDDVEPGSEPTKDYEWQYRYKLSDADRQTTKENSPSWGDWYTKGVTHWTVTLSVAFSGKACSWVDVPTGEYREIPAMEARPARREEITRRELQC